MYAQLFRSMAARDEQLKCVYSLHSIIKVLHHTTYLVCGSGPVICPAKTTHIQASAGTDKELTVCSYSEFTYSAAKFA